MFIKTHVQNVYAITPFEIAPNWLTFSNDHQATIMDSEDIFIIFIQYNVM